MKFAGVACTLALVLVACPVLASADPIILFGTLNAVAVAATSFQSPPVVATDGGRDAIAAKADAGDALGSAVGETYLFSTVSPLSLSGTGWTNATIDTAGEAYAEGSSFYEVGFRLDRAYDATFLGQFATSGSSAYDVSHPNTKTSWEAMLRNGTATSMPFRYVGEDTETRSSATRLDAGDWLLYVSGYADAATHVPGGLTAWTQYTFSLMLTPAGGAAPAPTPEPASMLLLGTGLAGAFAARRRR